MKINPVPIEHRCDSETEAIEGYLSWLRAFPKLKHTIITKASPVHVGMQHDVRAVAYGILYRAERDGYQYERRSNALRYVPKDKDSLDWYPVIYLALEEIV